MADMKSFLAKVAAGQRLTREDAESAFDIIMSGEATPSQIGGFLMALRVRGETVDEIAGAVRSMRGRMTPVVAPEGSIDIVGTGGDASGTYNISTCSAFVVAGAGRAGGQARQPRAPPRIRCRRCSDRAWREDRPCPRKNRPNAFARRASASCSRRTTTPPCAMSAASRVELGTRTVFNLLGLLCNPPEREACATCSACSRANGWSRSPQVRLAGVRRSAWGRARLVRRARRPRRDHVDGHDLCRRAEERDTCAPSRSTPDRVRASKPSTRTPFSGGAPEAERQGAKEPCWRARLLRSATS